MMPPNNTPLTLTGQKYLPAVHCEHIQSLQQNILFIFIIVTTNVTNSQPRADRGGEKWLNG
jgi:hypothetical protein